MKLGLGSGSARERCTNHVGVDHAGALVNSSDAVGAPVAEGEHACA